MSYLSSYIHSGNKNQRSVKTSWAGLNRSLDQDSGELTYAKNIGLSEYPFLKSSRRPLLKWSAPEGHTVVSMHSTGDNTFAVITNSGGDLYFHYYDGENTKHVSASFGTYTEGETPSIAVFNVYNASGNNIVSAGFKRMVLLYPYCLSFDPTAATPSLKVFNTSGNSTPKLKKVTVLNGRVFGVLDGKIYASEWNNYAGWRLPTANNDSTALAWCSTTQSDIDASGDFTAVTVYDGQVIGFKRNFMHMIYNNKAPFRIVDIGKIGAISQEAVCEVNQTLFFVSDDGVYAFSGGYPKRISDKLDIKNYSGAVLGGDKRTLYLYIPQEDNVFTYDTVYGAWGGTFGKPKACATIVNSCYYASGDSIYEFCAGSYGDFEFETDASLGGTLSEKKVTKIKLQVIHDSHNEGDRITLEIMKKDGSVPVSKTIAPEESGDYVISMLTRMTCSMGQKLRVSGTGEWEIRYLQTDYTSGGETYV